MIMVLVIIDTET